MSEAHNLVKVVAAVGVVLVLFAGYTILQLNGLDSKISSFQGVPNLQDRLTVLDQRITSLETNVQALQIAVQQLQASVPKQMATITYFYDSTCTICDHTFLNGVDQFNAQLSSQGVKIVVQDVSKDYSTLQGEGIARLPAFFVKHQDSNNSGVQLFVKTLVQQANYVLQITLSGGAALLPPTSSITLGSSCNSSKTVDVKYFYSDTCLYCVRVRNDTTGQIINQPSNGSYSVVASEGLADLGTKLGTYLNLTKECVNAKPGDEQKCVSDIGEGAFNNSMLLSSIYWVRQTPSIVIDCKHVFGGLVTENSLQNAVCSVRPDICQKAGLNASISIISS